MSGQPYKYAKDVNRYRQNYMDSLNLRTSLDDVNLQANKTYKATGQLPAVSSLPDTRTTSEKFADIEKMKLTLVAEMKPIASANVALEIIQRITNSPYNKDGVLFKFFAQTVKSFVTKLGLNYAYGIDGESEINKFVTGVEDAFLSSDKLTDTVSNFFKGDTTFNALTQTSYKGFIEYLNGAKRYIDKLNAPIGVKTNINLLTVILTDLSTTLSKHQTTLQTATANSMAMMSAHNADVTEVPDATDMFDELTFTKAPIWNSVTRGDEAELETNLSHLITEAARVLSELPEVGELGKKINELKITLKNANTAETSRKLVEILGLLPSMDIVTDLNKRLGALSEFNNFFKKKIR